MDTHTAVAYKVYEEYVKETGDVTPTLIASTASAYKFADSVAESLGLPKEEDEFACIEAVNKTTGVPIPKGLQGLKEKPVRHNTVISVQEMKEAVRSSL